MPRRCVRFRNVPAKNMSSKSEYLVPVAWSQTAHPRGGPPPLVLGTSPRPKPISKSYPGIYPQSYSSCTSKQRLAELSKPKEVKSQWLTMEGMSAMWGTQDLLSPISSSALKGEVPGRVETLSKPKYTQVDQNSSNSLYWGDASLEATIWPISKGALVCIPKPRILQLAEPRVRSNTGVSSLGRDSAIWELPQGKPKGDLARIGNLAQHKDVPKEFKSNRETPATIVRPSTLKAHPTGRVESLAAAKNRTDGNFREPIWEVPHSARRANPSSRVTELAKCKNIADGYQPERPVIWEVPHSAKRALASTRLHELSAPVVRATMDNIKYNPDAFRVKPEALTSICPPRVEELAQPIQR